MVLLRKKKEKIEGTDMMRSPKEGVGSINEFTKNIFYFDELTKENAMQRCSLGRPHCWLDPGLQNQVKEINRSIIIMYLGVRFGKNLRIKSTEINLLVLMRK